MDTEPEPETLKDADKNAAALPDRQATTKSRRGRSTDPPTNAFRKGHNSHTGVTFMRGPDMIPRGSIRLMYAMVLKDRREAIYRSLLEGRRRSDGTRRVA